MTHRYDNLACSVGGKVCVCVCVCRFVAICYHALITQTVAPESLEGRQHSVSLPVSGSVFRPPTCCLLPSFLMLVCSVSHRMMDQHPNIGRVHQRFRG